FILENFAATLAAVPNEALPRRVVLVSVGDMLGVKGHVVNLVLRYIKRAIPAYSLAGTSRFAAVLREGVNLSWSRPQVSMDDVAILQYTGGTTGTPKAAMLTQRNLVANVLQVQAVA